MSLPSIPLLLVTGALGAGKTRLFQRIAPFAPFDQALIIVNEFSDTTIDDRLMQNKRGKAKPLAGGCVCCTSRHELLTLVQLALTSDTPPKAIVIETTGLASPQPILAALAGNNALAARLDLRILSVVDATTLSYLQSTPQMAEQWAIADAIILTKTDLIADKSFVAALDSSLTGINPLARIIHGADQSDVALAQFLANLGAPHADDLRRQDLAHSPDKFEASVGHIGAIGSIVLQHGVPVALPTIEAFLFALARELGRDLMRLKGFVHIAGQNNALLLVQTVQGVVSPPEWTAIDQGQKMDSQTNIKTEIVLIAEREVLIRAERLFAGIVQGLASDTPDAEALNNNPLSIAGC